MKDQHLGKFDTPERNAYEFELKVDVLGDYPLD
jgi:hypothetical protein